MEAAIRTGQRYRNDPLAFMTECLDVDPNLIWDKMEQIILSVRDNKKTAVKAGHSVSKSYSAARLALWFLYCFGPATVITTAPNDKQVENILWREIRQAHSLAKVPLGGDVTRKKIDLAEKWFAFGFSTRPDTVTKEATSFQGYHNEHVLVIFDEAAGIMPAIWQASEALLTSGHCRFLAIGNPTSAFGDFVGCFDDDSDYNKITVSVKDTPNYKLGQEVIPGVSGREYEAMMRKKHGENSNRYRSRVLGEFPEHTEGAIYGKWLAEARANGRICDLPYDKSALVHTAWDLGVGDATTIWFFQLISNRIHVIDYYENCGEGMEHYAKVLDDKRCNDGYMYGFDFLPHDAAQRQQGRVVSTRLDILKELGRNAKLIADGKPLRLEDGIEKTRQLLSRCWFDRLKCKVGLNGLGEYHWSKNERMSTEDRPLFSNVPEHDWTSHPADGFRYTVEAILRHLGGGSGVGSMTSDKAKELYEKYARPA